MKSGNMRVDPTGTAPRYVECDPGVLRCRPGRKVPIAAQAEFDSLQRRLIDEFLAGTWECQVGVGIKRKAMVILQPSYLGPQGSFELNVKLG